MLYLLHLLHLQSDQIFYDRENQSHHYRSEFYSLLAMLKDLDELGPTMMECKVTL